MTHSPLPQRIYPIVDRASWVSRLGKAGARFIQLRIKDLSGDGLKSEIKDALAAASDSDVTLVINDFWEMAIDLGATYVHLGQEDLDTADRDKLREAGIRIGISTHSVPELTRALELAPDYVALGPIWPTRLKKMAFGPQGTHRLTEWRERIGDLPLVAIGGITLARAPECIAAGADCVAAVSDFIFSEDPESQISLWIKAIASSS
ncbi:thiamine phosphate synthase [Acetobacter oeni]|uniref:Thiamine-phosphate synthase n=1 Tax=Acetobacter oeni TaxID=304077 RepID=A0A511XGK9_9PROT|nr:thiamine phosphate synthase [Acetobacter oeni]MBB3881746.1 thiamine-phosphate pyrophosphorylase [Acetobacter oeni]NHO17452.1 thiamine phosphate synthase [Acetobacter oeni]GBR01915.1 thiamine phosphate pyrophosphorylase [Acetobacter oeni LMG 21952]GEN62083.1 thiamine-phosphate synthase [Acetobacter oeni]